MRRALVLAVTAALLTGCSSIPSSGPIVQGDRIDVAQSDVNVRVIARPPTPGMSPEQLVRGFLSACASVGDGDDTARMYLTAGASTDWNPQRLTEVYDVASLAVTAERDGGVKVSASLLGSIDAQHRYHVADVGAVLADVLHLSQVAGQWRIDKAPPALYLGESDVKRSYRVHSLYFLNGALDRLVPEFVMVPVSTSNVPELLIRALLAGPANAVALRTAIPAHTSLAGGPPPQDFGAVSVALTTDALSTDAVQRTAMLAQIAWTLNQLPSVGSVRVEAGGQLLEDSSGHTSFASSDLQSFDPMRANADRALVYVTKNDVWSLRSGVRTKLAGAISAAEAASAADGSLVTAVSANRKFLYAVLGAGPWVLSSGGDLAAPQVLGPYEAWFLDREIAGGGITMWASGVGVTSVRTGLPKRARVSDFSIAPDGVRIAVIVNDGATSTLRVGSIVRADGVVRIVGLARVEQKLSSVTAVAWSSASELVAIGAVGSASGQPVRVTLPIGSVDLLGGPANPVSITAAPGQPVVVGDQSGQMWKLSGDKWTASELGASPHYVQ